MAKYYMVDLRDDRNILSHLFLNCLTPEIIDKIQLSREGKTEEELKKEKIEIRLQFNGIEIDPKPFFDIFWEQYDQIVTQEATKMVETQTSDKMRELSGKLIEFEEIVQDWAKYINWDVKNPFNKIEK